jgi:release factor glutamine methyltransferase
MIGDVPHDVLAIRHWLEHHLSPISDSPQVEAWQLLEALLDRPKHTLIGTSVTLENHQKAQLKGWLERRIAREPLQYILGYAYFYGYRFQVTPAVLIPRPETEVLVHAVLDELKTLAKTPTVLDMGTGSGAIAITIKRERPEATVLASDISQEALELAQQNAHALNAEVTFVLSNLLEEVTLQNTAQQTDIIVANLPYLPEDDRHWLSPEVLHEPDTALFAGEDGLSLADQLIQQAFGLLATGAKLYLELDPRNVTRALAQTSMWSKKDVLADLAGRERFLLLTR